MKTVITTKLEALNFLLPLGVFDSHLDVNYQDIFDAIDVDVSHQSETDIRMTLLESGIEEDEGFYQNIDTGAFMIRLDEALLLLIDQLEIKNRDPLDVYIPYNDTDIEESLQDCLDVAKYLDSEVIAIDDQIAFQKRVYDFLG